MIDLQVVKFKEKIVNDINESGLPLSLIAYVLGEVSQMVGSTLEQQIEQLRRQEVESLVSVDEDAQVDVEV